MDQFKKSLILLAQNHINNYHTLAEEFRRQIYTQATKFSSTDYSVHLMYTPDDVRNLGNLSDLEANLLNAFNLFCKSHELIRTKSMTSVNNLLDEDEPRIEYTLFCSLF